MTVIAGVDLAWSGRKPTGLCVLRVAGATVALERLECLPAGGGEVVAGLLEGQGANVVAGIDAPLVVTANRRAESALARAYGRRGVYAYAARQDFLERRGIAEGPRLGALLRGAGWQLDPSRMEPRGPGRFALEVFPHATAVALLGAGRVIRYKKSPLAGRAAPLAEYQALLRHYAEQELPCLLGTGAAGLLTDSPAVFTGRSLKDVEDRLDSVACAIAAYHAWRFGGEGLEVFGDCESGCIAVPVRATSSPAPSCP